MERRIASTLRRFPWLVAEDESGVLGYAYAGEHRERPAYQWSVDVSCYVDEACAATRHRLAALQTRSSASSRRRDSPMRFAGIALPNAASVGMHESVGFVVLGYYRNVGFKLGEWHDTVWMQRVLPSPSTIRDPRFRLSPLLRPSSKSFSCRSL